MNTRKILAILLALMLALPALALAEGGSFTLTLSDPVLELYQGAETTTQDLTGVALQVGGAVDMDAEEPQGLLSLVLLAKDDPAVSAMVGLNGAELYALCTGISSVIKLPLDQIEQALAEQGASIPGLGDQAAALADVGAILEKFQFTEGPSEDVQFYNTTGNCPRKSAHLSRQDLTDLLQDTGAALPEDASLDLSLFEDGQGNVRLEGSANDVIDSSAEGERSIGFVFVAEIKDEMTSEGGAWIGNTAFEINCNFAGGESADFPGKPQFDLVANLAAAGDEEADMAQIQASLAPNQAADGTVADVLNITALAGEQVLGTVGGAVYVGEDAEYYSLSITDNTTGDGFGFVYEGAIAKAADGEEHTGKLTVDFGMGELKGSAALNIAANTSAGTEGKFPDIGGMPAIELENMTQEQTDQLTTEATQLMFSAMGKMMAVPGIAAILANTMQAAN